MKKRHSQVVEQYKKGQFVTIFAMDKRDRAGQINTGIHSVVVNNPRAPSFSVEVATVHGLVVGRNPKRPNLFPMEQVQPLFPGVPVSQRLEELKAKVLKRCFRRNDLKHVSFRSAHAEAVGVSKVAPHRCRCRSKEDRCKTNRCICRKNGHPCTSACGCGHDCCNRED